MNTSTQHPPHLSGAPEEGNLHDTHIPTPQWVSNLAKGISKRVGDFIEVVKVRLEEQKKIDVERGNLKKIEEICIACKQSRNFELVILGIHIQKAGNVNEKNAMGNTALIEASVGGHTKIIQLLLAHQEILVNKKNKYDYTPLTLASSNGHTEIVQLLLADHRLDLMAHDQWKEALMQGIIPEIKILIQNAMNK